MKSRSPVVWRVTGEFWAVTAAWAAGAGAFDVALRAHGGTAALAWGPLERAFDGPPLLVALLWGLALTLAMAVHEGGHALVARHVGATEIAVVLGGLHGRTAYDLDDPYSLRRAAVVAAGAWAPVLTAPLLLVPHLAALAVVGCGLAVVNLLPAPMSDGGHLVEIAMSRLVGRAAAARSAAAVDLVVLAGCFVLGLTGRVGWLAALCAPLLVLAVLAVSGRLQRATAEELPDLV